MFDITSSKLLLLGIVALLVIGPKDLPVLLRTIGKYIGIIKRQAKEFRAQFDEAMRETELEPAQEGRREDRAARPRRSCTADAGQSVEQSSTRRARASTRSMDTAAEARRRSAARTMPTALPSAARRPPAARRSH